VVDKATDAVLPQEGRSKSDWLTNLLLSGAGAYGGQALSQYLGYDAPWQRILAGIAGGTMGPAAFNMFLG
jgi:hypothetical protein